MLMMSSVKFLTELHGINNVLQLYFNCLKAKSKVGIILQVKLSSAPLVTSTCLHPQYKYVSCSLKIKVLTSLYA